MEHYSKSTYTGVTSCQKTVRFVAHPVFRGVRNSRMCHVALTTPTYGTVGHLKINTSRGQIVHKT